jgi:hypothetical protein
MIRHVAFRLSFVALLLLEMAVRYGSLEGIDEAAQLAQKACAVHSKTARLRNTANFGLNERYGHFDCI